jgi:hypothetical protein
MVEAQRYQGVGVKAVGRWPMEQQQLKATQPT